MTDPIAALHADRARARGADDPMANLCMLATVGASKPEVRTLVLRDVEGRLGLFFNASSPKAREIRQSATVAVLVYLPSLSLQYRLRARLADIPAATVHTQWRLRPDVPKRMDWLYEQRAQSSPVESRDALVASLGVDVPDRAPTSAIGFYLVPETVERLDLGQANGVHDRRRYTLQGERWTEQVLVP